MGWRVIGVAGRGGKATGQKDLLRPALEEIIDLGHPLVRLAREIDWGVPDRRFSSVCTPGPGRPGLPTRLVASLQYSALHPAGRKMLPPVGGPMVRIHLPPAVSPVRT
jgi:hypothetical protein